MDSDTLEQPATESDSNSEIHVSNVIGGLAHTLEVGGTLLLAIARTDEEHILITVQPRPAKDEEAGTVLPLQVVGNPDDIDRDLVTALKDYVAARVLAVRTAREIREETERETKAIKERSAKTAEARKPKLKTCPLVVKVKPRDATITITGADGTNHPCQGHGKTNVLNVGKYTVTASKPGYNDATETVTLAGKRVITALELTEAPPTLFEV